MPAVRPRMVAAPEGCADLPALQVRELGQAETSTEAVNFRQRLAPHTQPAPWHRPPPRDRDLSAALFAALRTGSGRQAPPGRCDRVHYPRVGQLFGPVKIVHRRAPAGRSCWSAQSCDRIGNKIDHGPSRTRRCRPWARGRQGKIFQAVFSSFEITRR